MDEKIRKERFEKYGSFLFCPKRKVLCFGRDTDEECKHASCLLDDPEYQALQKRIEENQKKNQQQECEKEHTRIRKQTKTKIELIEEAIKKKDKEARAAYRANYPKEGDRIINEVIRLRGLLRQEKEHGRRKKDNKTIRKNG